MRPRALVGLLLLAFLGVLVPLAGADEKKPKKYARFQVGDKISYGRVEGEEIRELTGKFGAWKKTDKTYPLSKVKLLVPVKPTQVLAMAGNYKSHLAGEEITEKFKIPQVFFKSPSCLIAQNENIVIPKGTNEVHFEAELVIVIGKKARNVPKEMAMDYVFGVTCGNDVSARDWQKGDVQWWRAKGSDTFGPVGPFIVTGINYDDLLVQMRVNGEVKQSQRTKDFIHNVSAMVSFISQHITLHQGDIIFTGTPAKTSAIKPGDICEVDIEGIGVLKNPVVGLK